VGHNNDIQITSYYNLYIIIMQSIFFRRNSKYFRTLFWNKIDEYAETNPQQPKNHPLIGNIIRHRRRVNVYYRRRRRGRKTVFRNKWPVCVYTHNNTICVYTVCIIRLRTGIPGRGLRAYYAHVREQRLTNAVRACIPKSRPRNSLHRVLHATAAVKYRRHIKTQLLF